MKLDSKEKIKKKNKSVAVLCDDKTQLKPINLVQFNNPSEILLYVRCCAGHFEEIAPALELPTAWQILADLGRDLSLLVTEGKKHAFIVCQLWMKKMSYWIALYGSPSTIYL